MIIFLLLLHRTSFVCMENEVEAKEWTIVKCVQYKMKIHTNNNNNNGNSLRSADTRIYDNDLVDYNRIGVTNAHTMKQTYKERQMHRDRRRIHRHRLFYCWDDQLWNELLNVYSVCIFVFGYAVYFSSSSFWMVGVFSFCHCMYYLHFE